ncbi:virion structural protein [Gordonia phage NadineRae]|uniref:Uncharacterized protein n=1 Tax=Gordonia phage NadineRae TaxID=2652882 RepID=A0A5P8DH12_9CAUD|nr:virion structural protein [Gordonia phage NadineRae]QFP97722.1 hypothetical protein SEA_NADINERAE_36 [Gordonia phage NadineRae]
MAFEPVQLVHPKTGATVTATTAVDLTTFRFNDGYVPADSAEALLRVDGNDKKYPKLAEGLKSLKAEKDSAPDDVKEVSSTKTGKPSGQTAKSGTDASGKDVGVS